MNRFFIILITFVCCTAINAQTVSYYKLTKKVHNGKISVSVSGGQFITFLQDICYESDKRGVGVGHGKLKLNKGYSNGTYKLYMGSSYWGTDATFKFKYDLSVLNVILENGDTYVYRRLPAPASVTTCSLIRKKTPVAIVVLIHLHTLIMVMEEVTTLTTVVRHHLLKDRIRFLLGRNQQSIHVVCAMVKEELLKILIHRYMGKVIIK